MEETDTNGATMPTQADGAKDTSLAINRDDEVGEAIRRFVKLTNEIADLAAMITKCFDEINEVMQIFVEPGADGQQADGAQQEGTV